MTSGLTQALWSNRPTYEEILRDMETDYKVRLPDRVALQFYDSFAMTQFREMQQQTNESEAQKDEHRREAVVTAAADEGVGRQELQQFANQLHPQRQHVNTELINNLRPTQSTAAAGWRSRQPPSRGRWRRSGWWRTTTCKPCKAT